MSKGHSNRKRKAAEAEEYFFAGYVNPDGTVDYLLLTRADLERAKRRADKNPEDVPADFVVLQVSNCGRKARRAPG